MQLPENENLDRNKWRLNRRRFLQGIAATAAVGSGLLGWATQVEPHWLEISRHSLLIANLPEPLVGKSLVHISDFHIGKTDLDYLVSAVDVVNNLRADLIVLTGDFIDHAFVEATKDVRILFSELQPAKLATIGCLGNHDYGHEWAQLKVADSVASAMQDCGVQILRDEHLSIDGLEIFGLDDYWSPRYQASKVLRQANPAKANLCLCHNPDVCDKDVWGEFQGTILAGHTHGGQCKPPFLPPPRIPVENSRYVSGFYDVGRGRELYINRGIGHGLKARFNCRPEITLFTLEKMKVESEVG